MLFDLGQIVTTPGALRAMQENGVDAWSLLRRHIHGDWGDLTLEDKRENQRSLENGYRLLSSYRLNTRGDKVWVITEADRSSTCLLLPTEY